MQKKTDLVKQKKSGPANEKGRRPNKKWGVKLKRWGCNAKSKTKKRADLANEWIGVRGLVGKGGNASKTQ